MYVREWKVIQFNSTNLHYCKMAMYPLAITCTCAYVLLFCYTVFGFILSCFLRFFKLANTFQCDPYGVIIIKYQISTRVFIYKKKNERCERSTALRHCWTPKPYRILLYVCTCINNNTCLRDNSFYTYPPPARSPSDRPYLTSDLCAIHCGVLKALRRWSVELTRNDLERALTSKQTILTARVCG